MSKLALVPLALVALTATCASGTPEPQAPPAPTPATAPPADAPAAAPALDLSTADKARATIHDVLARGDKEAFRKCVSKRILERQAAVFDAWYAVWKAAAEKGPAENFQKIAVTQEDGVYKLDEN